MSDLGSRLKAFKQVGNEYVPIIVDDYGNEQEAIFYPLPGSQQLVLSAPEFEVLYEGTRGPGKTLTLIMDFCQDVGTGWGAEWKGMIIRRTYPELADVISMSKKWIKRIWPTAFYNEIKSFWQFPDGELLYFRPIRTVDDYDAHHGTNYTWLGWEELTLWPDDAPYKRMMSVVRSSIRKIPLRVRATTNPYGVGHNWVQARFQLYNWPRLGKIIGPLITGTVDENGVPEHPRKAIHGRLEENIVMMHTDPGYVSRIRSAARNKAELEAWLHGSWDIAAGGMFDDIWFSHKEDIVLPDFEVPHSWAITRAYDHGSSKPWSCGWYAESDGTDLILPNGRVRSTIRGDLFRVGECYGWHPGQPNVGRRMLTSEIKKEIIQYEIKRRWRDPGTGKCRVRRGPADTGIFDDVNGVCIAEDFEHPIVIDGVRYRGIIWEKADKGPGSREQGWEQARKRLKATKRPEGGYREEKGLFICECCTQWLRTVPVLPRDEKKIDDVDCWVAGTMISTPDGDHPIEDIRVGDLVETPIGPRPVLQAYASGTSETVIAKLSDGRTLEGTPHHKIFVKGVGLVALAELQCYMVPKERIIWQELSGSCIAALSTGATRVASIIPQTGQSCLRAARAFIDRFGSTPDMIYPPDGTCTTKTTTTTTTNSGILSASLQESMPDTISKDGNRQWLPLGSPGVRHQKVRLYSKKMDGNYGPAFRSANLRAVIVKNLLRLDTLDKYIVRIGALIPPGLLGALKNVARFVVQNFSRNHTAPKKSEPARIVAVGHSAAKKPVYNLTVAVSRLFYANGCLSSNTDAEDHCGDETRYRLRYETRTITTRHQ